jgi:hypothetical protein
MIWMARKRCCERKSRWQLLLYKYSYVESQPWHWAPW